MNRIRKMYDKEFKLNAIRFYEESGKKLREVEEELGIGAGCISHWRRELKGDKDSFRGNGKMSEEQKELARLRRENEILREEREILKKVVGMFSKPSK
jgi:transposase